MRTGFRSLFVLVTVQLFLECPRGTPLTPNHAPGFKHDHLLAHMLRVNKAHVMSKLKQMAFSPGSVSPEINIGMTNAINGNELNTGVMDVINKDLIHIVNAVPGVVSVSIGTPGKTMTNVASANSPWDAVANGVAFPNSVSSFNKMGSHKFNGNINPLTNSNNDFNINARNVPFISGAVNPLNRGSFSTPDTFSEIHNPTVTSSVSNGVQVLQSTLNGGGNLFELVLPDSQFVNKTDVVSLAPRSEEIPSKYASNFASSNAQPHDVQVDTLQLSVDPIDAFLTGLTNLVPVTQETVSSAGLAVNMVPDSKHAVSLVPDSKHAVSLVPDFKHAMDLVPVSQHAINVQDIATRVGDFPVVPSAVSPDTLLSLENAFRLIPVIGKARDFNTKAGTTQHNILTDIGHGQNVNNSSGLQVVAVGLGKIDGTHVPDAQIKTYDPFSTRLKPEAFGPGPYYECSPPSQVVCGARIGWDDVIGMSVWCKENCIVFNYSSYCDDDRCKCECVAPAV